MKPNADPSGRPARRGSTTSPPTSCRVWLAVPSSLHTACHAGLERHMHEIANTSPPPEVTGPEDESVRHANLALIVASLGGGPPERSDMDGREATDMSEAQLEPPRAA